jgi:hypothetical protein
MPTTPEELIRKLIADLTGARKAIATFLVALEDADEGLEAAVSGFSEMLAKLEEEAR